MSGLGDIPPSSNQQNVKNVNFKYLFQFYPTQSCRGKIMKIQASSSELHVLLDATLLK